MTSNIATTEARTAELTALLTRTALGDRRAFRKIYDLSSAQLLGVILRIHRDRTQAEDVLQDVFVKIWAAAGTFEAHRAQPMTWMSSIARHRAIDCLRRLQTEPALVSTSADDADGDAHDLTEQVASDKAGPQELLDQALQARLIKTCMACLSSEQQQSLALAYYDGLTHSEVADHLGEPLGTIKSWLRRGLQALRQCIDRSSVPVEPSGA